MGDLSWPQLMLCRSSAPKIRRKKPASTDEMIFAYKGALTMDSRAVLEPGSGTMMVFEMASSCRQKSDCTLPLAGLKMQYSKLVQKRTFPSIHAKLCKHLFSSKIAADNLLISDLIASKG